MSHRAPPGLDGEMATPTALGDVTASRTAVGLAGLQLLLHAVATVAARDPRTLVPHAVAWLHDVALLAGIAAACHWLPRVGPARTQAAARLGARLLLLAVGALLALYPSMLQAFLATPVSFLEADWGSLSVFAQDYAGLGALWPAAVAVGIGAVAGRIVWLRPPRVRPGLWIPVGVLMLASFGGLSPNPIVFGLQDAFRQLLAPRTVPRLQVTAVGAGGEVVPAQLALGGEALRADRVLLVVLESVTAAGFEGGFLGRRGGFFDRNRSRARYFSRYYATNLDSYTSLIAMTTSIQVPFRAYAAPARYARVNQAPNLARALRGAGFHAAYLSTYEHQPFVPNPDDWDRVCDRRDLGDLTGWTSLGASRMEAATEDRAALPRLARFAAGSPRSLVLAELVFGHSPEWRARTGITPVEYSDRYLSDLWERLGAAGQTTRTLLIVVSDHGDRSGAAQPENYRVPLLLVGDGVDPGRDDLLRSHLDLQAIIAHVVRGSPMPEPRREVRLVGSSERWIYGAMRDDGAYLFIDDNSGRALGGALDPGAVHADFQAYVASFTSAFVGGSSAPKRKD